MLNKILILRYWVDVTTSFQLLFYIKKFSGVKLSKTKEKDKIQMRKGKIVMRNNQLVQKIK